MWLNCLNSVILNAFMRKLFLFLFVFTSFHSFSQKMSISGNVQDTTAKIPVKNAVVMAVRIKDSVLIAHTRSDENGRFALNNLATDTIQVIITEPRFGEQSYYVFGSTTNNAFDFGKIVLPAKSQQLNEVIIYAFKDPVYYKGDTLVYTADSFKVKPNATVEDLLKRLPGIKVDANGKITSQGKEVSQVLVDGDEFFGTDPTVATKNLTAQGVESVQVYEKKNEEATDGGDETIQVMNLKMKEDAKKGYFGKISAASDFQQFHEGELLANKFKGSQKISVFALASNTPRSSFGWGDMYKYGLDNEMNMNEDDDGNRYWYNNNQNSGIPKTLKSGFYYSDKLGKKTKINLNYTYNNNQLNAKSTTRSQYFLVDTSYVLENQSQNDQKSETHNINFKIVQTIDSLTELEIKPKLQLNGNTTKSYSLNLFKTIDDTLTRSNEVQNKNNAKGYDFTTSAKLTRKFKKKDRLLILNYSYNKKNDAAEGILKSMNTYYSGFVLPKDSLNQKKENSSDKQVHNAKFTYTEPLSKKMKLEFEYIVNANKNKQNKKSQNYFNGEYAINDTAFSNNFGNFILYNRAGVKYIFETKKNRFVIGVRGQNNKLSNTNLISNTSINYTTSAVLPFLSYMYRFSENSRYNFAYYTFASQPTINQLQPVQDNTNPNRIIIGNPNLKPTYNNHFEMSYNVHKPITGRYVWANANFNIVNNDFANAAKFDSLGRTISQTVNVDGNYDGSFYIGSGMPILSKLIQFEPSINGNVNKNSNYVNGQKNSTHSSNIQASLNIVLQTDSIEFSIGGNYSWNQTQSSLNVSSNKPYGEQQYSAALTWTLPYKFLLETDVQYNIYSKRTAGYNFNYFLWNAKLSKAFLKNENFIITFEANDMLNQNINTNRTIEDNVITDSKTNIISRYFLLRLTYKFNSTKTKDVENDW